jgi:hypothetical protein
MMINVLPHLLPEAAVRPTRLDSQPHWDRIFPGHAWSIGQGIVQILGSQKVDQGSILGDPRGTYG